MTILHLILEILAHPKTKIFITHGGLKRYIFSFFLNIFFSVKEGLCSSTPMIFLPLFAEQAHNAHMALALGFGLVINKFNLNANSLYSTINIVCLKKIQTPFF